MSDHAMLSPSSAHRWAECPGSVALSIGVADRGSSYASEGTRAHDIAAACLQLGVHPSDIAGNSTTFDLDAWGSIEAYVDYVGALGPEEKRLVEFQVPIDHITGEHDAVGTVDCIVDAGDVVHVVDYKHGQGVLVPAEDNLQLVMYAAGYIHHRGEKPREVGLHIVQPRRQNMAMWVVPIAQLEAIVLRLMAAAERVWEALQAEHMDDAWRREYLAPGSHCKFCKALPTCPAVQGIIPGLNDGLLDGFADLGAKLNAHADSLGPDDIGRYIELLPVVETWIARIRDLAMGLAKHGELPGYKLVAGRANRRWIDEAMVVEKLLALGFDESEIYETRLRSPADIEKRLGKAKAEIAGLVMRPQGKPVLAKVDDPRPEYAGADDFENLEDL